MESNTLIVAVIILLPFVFVIFIVALKNKENRKRDQLKADLYLKAIEKGVTLPDNLLETPKKKNSSLKTGILMIAIGIGISLFMLLTAEPDIRLKATATGLIPLFIGLGFLAVHLIWKKQGIPDDEE